MALSESKVSTFHVSEFLLQSLVTFLFRKPPANVKIKLVILAILYLVYPSVIIYNVCTTTSV